MRRGWKINKLGDICKNLDKQRIPITKKDRKTGLIPYYGASGIVDSVAEYLFNEDLLCVSEDGANLLARTYPIAFSINGKTWVNNHAHVLRFENIDSQKFVELYLNSIKLDEFVSGMAQPKLNQTQLNKIPVPLPPLPEQKRIVSILDRAFEAIDKAKANAEQNLKNAKELFESYLQGVFENKGDDWINSTIGKTCNLITGGTPSRSKSEYFKNGTINWLVSGDINKKAINECDGKITELGLKNSNAKFLPLNSVMIALNGQGKTRGTVAMLKIKATCNQSLVSIYPKDDNEVLPELIFSNLQGRYNEIRKITGDSGNDRRGLNMPLIRKIKFSYPKSIAKQQQIVRKLDTLSTETKKLESIYQQKINDLEELKKSILQKAFAGELTDKEIAI